MCGVAFVEEREESNKPVILLICYVGVRFGLKYKKKKLSCKVITFKKVFELFITFKKLLRNLISELNLYCM